MWERQQRHYCLDGLTILLWLMKLLSFDGRRGIVHTRTVGRSVSSFRRDIDCFLQAFG
jgi:hypothetical protein